VAAADTIPFYVGVKVLSRYLEIDPTVEHGADLEMLRDEGSGRDGTTG
jgi:hypothetical protein